MLGLRGRMISGDEMDCFHRSSRRGMVSFQRPSVTSKTKARFNRRMRRQDKAAASRMRADENPRYEA